MSQFILFIYLKLVRFIMRLYCQSPKVKIRYKLTKMPLEEQDSTNIWMSAMCQARVGETQ